MRYFIYLVILIMPMMACKGRDECAGFETAAQLQATDLIKCKADSMFYQLKRFSLAFNEERKKLGIPVLPADYLPEVYTVGNQVRWHSEIDDRYFSKGLPYMKWKDLEWSGDTLKYDRSIISEGKKEHPSNTLNITYWLDTLVDHKTYRIRYHYSPKNDTTDMVLSRFQADSILISWKLIN
jgi:hypothetical protein